jgi:hypothetical protein
MERSCNTALATHQIAGRARLPVTAELTALERGLHALHSSMDVKAYAGSVGRARTTVQDEVKAARVASSVTDIRHDLWQHFAKLVEIHAAPAWLWPALVAAMLPCPWARFLSIPASARVGRVSRGTTREPRGAVLFAAARGTSSQPHRRLLMRDHLAGAAFYQMIYPGLPQDQNFTTL